MIDILVLNFWCLYVLVTNLLLMCQILKVVLIAICHCMWMKNKNVSPNNCKTSFVLESFFITTLNCTLYAELITTAQVSLKVQPKSISIFHGRMSYCFCGVKTLCPIDFRGSGHFVLSLVFSVHHCLLLVCHPESGNTQESVNITA